jgi:hypothetical protein
MTNDRQIEITPTPDARSTMPAPIPCPDCRGRGQILLPISTRPCLRWSGAGHLPPCPALHAARTSTQSH